MDKPVTPTDLARSQMAEIPPLNSTPSSPEIPPPNCTSHTPGPWISAEKSPHNGTYRVGPAGKTGPEGVFPYVAVVTNSCYGVTVGQQLANVRLIAAAPQLLEALQTARLLLMRVSADDPISSCYRTEEDVAEIEEAIANATGEGLED